MLSQLEHPLLVYLTLTRNQLPYLIIIIINLGFLYKNLLTIQLKRMGPLKIVYLKEISLSKLSNNLKKIIFKTSLLLTNLSITLNFKKNSIELLLIVKKLKMKTMNIVILTKKNNF